MKVRVKCFSTLVTNEKCDYKNSTIYELDNGQTVEDLVHRTGVDRGKVKIALVNNRSVGLDTVLSDGDRVGLAPAIGGM